MTGLPLALLAVAGVLALADWLAVARRDKRLEYAAKPATLIALIGLALAIDPGGATGSTRQAWWVAALVLSLAGDVFLMLPGRFVPGLASFLLAHLAYVGGFVAAPAMPLLVPTLVALALVSAAIAAVAPRIVRGARAHDRRLTWPVLGYLAAISAMVVLALSSGNTFAATGAMLFFASDAMIGLRNFVRARGWHDLAIIVTYHLGQGLLVVSLTWSVR